ncbi:MAG: protein translocase subunit SecD, partial [Pseudomonadota bacterium]
MNKYPAWKYTIIIIALMMAFFYTAPNFFGDEPAVQVSGLRASKVDASLQTRVADLLKTANITTTNGVELDGEFLKIRLTDGKSQTAARDELQKQLGAGYVVALNMLSKAPAWFAKFNALPMYLGLDLRGGVHFLMQVDMKAAVNKSVDRYQNETRSLLRDKKIFYTGISRESDNVVIRFKERAEADKGLKEIGAQYQDLNIRDANQGDEIVVTLTMKPETMVKLKDAALQQNMTALRKRVNELGVSEPIVQQQGADRILIQLAGVQDPGQAKDIIGRTATLEFRMVADEHMSAGSFERYRTEPAPFGTDKMLDAQGRVVLVRKQVIVTGDKVTDAQPGFDTQKGNTPNVSVRLDGSGGRAMTLVTRDNIGKNMAVILIEKEKPEILSWPTIQGELGVNFQITGIPTSQEAKNLALLMRAGALAAPMEIIEERSIGPSLGAENVEKGKNSLLFGFALITVFMVIY